MADSNFVEQLTQKLREVGALHALGEQWISVDGTIPPGGVPFCGQNVSRVLYADLFAWAQSQGKVKAEAEWQEIASTQDGNCIFYSDGDGSTTFRMPCITGYLKGSVGTNDAGKWIEEGLPNVTGSWPADIGNKVQPEGAIYVAKDSVSSNATAGSTGSTDSLLGVDLSLSNPIYGNSDHVTPKTNTILVGVYAVSVITSFGSSDIDNLQTAITALETNKLDIADQRIGVIETWSSEDNFSWYRKYSDGFIIQGGGVASETNAGVKTTITLPLSFKTDQYNFIRGGQQHNTNNLYSAFVCTYLSKTNSEVTFWVDNKTNSGINGWVAFGY